MSEELTGQVCFQHDVGVFMGDHLNEVNFSDRVIYQRGVFAALKRLICLTLRDGAKNGLLANGIVPSKLRVAVLRLSGCRIARRVEISAMCFIGSGPLQIGEGAMLNYQVFLDPTAGISIGRNTRIGPRAMVITASHKVGGSEANRISRTPDADASLPVRIGDNVWIGAQATILPGVTIGNGVVIGAGAVVREDCVPNALYAGVPARIVRHLPP